MMRVVLVSFILILVGWGLSTQAQPDQCPEEIDTILTAADQTCSDLGRNQVCYGNHLIESELVEYDPFVFSTTGDIITVNDLTLLRTMPLSLETETWGIAIFNIQADLENTLPGQSVTMVVFGDTELSPDPDAPEGYDQPMQAFTFQTGIGFPACKAVPHGGVLIQNPTGASVHLQVNGFDLVISSTALLTAQTEQELTISTLEGNIQVSSANGQQDVPAGYTLTVTQDTPPEMPVPDAEIEVSTAALLPEAVPQPGEPQGENIGLLSCSISGGVDVSSGSTVTLRGGWAEDDVATLITAVRDISSTLEYDGENVVARYRGGPGPWNDGFAVNWYWVIDGIAPGTHQAVWSIAGESVTCELRAD